MSRHHVRILVVEDDRDVADTLGRLLKRHGHDVMVAYTGRVGLYAARAWLPEAVIRHIRLPGLDGYGVVRELRRDPATAGARMIAITSYGDEEHWSQSCAAGFDAHLTQPADPDLLCELLARSGSGNPPAEGSSLA
jgi:CheY-like chemotaxis protein